jgi:GNAT superfamily N-acetyltransferase
MLNENQRTPMTKSILVREARPSDIVAMKSIVDSTELFPSEMLDDMTAPFFNGNQAEEIWLIVEQSGQQVGLAYCASERMTQGTKNLLLIAVHKEAQGKRYGTALLAQLEKNLKDQACRVLIVETSGLPEYAATRRFYLKHGYTEEARIRDFYKLGEDKIVFWKNLHR